MIIVNCPKCNHPNRINIAEAVDEHGEEYICSNCGKQFRYATR